MNGITSLAADIITFIDNILVPLIFAASLVFFLWGVFKYFIQGGDNPGEQEKGRAFVTYSIIGFFLMISVWGIVRLLTGTFGFDGQTRPCLPTFSGKDNCGGTPADKGVLDARGSDTPVLQKKYTDQIIEPAPILIDQENNVPIPIGADEL